MRNAYEDAGLSALASAFFKTLPSPVPTVQQRSSAMDV